MANLIKFIHDNPTIFAAALFGAVAAIFVRVGIRLVQFIWLRYCVRWTNYDCSLSIHREGILHHAMGESVSDNKASNRNAWRYPANQDVLTGQVKEGGVIHGPYTNDFGKPGYYKARFEVRSRGLNKANRTLPMLQLEVVDSRPELAGANWITRTTEVGQRLLTEATLFRAKEYRKYDITFYSNGNGRYEYRAAILEKSWLAGKEIYFDRIRVRPWMFVREIFS